MEKQIQFPAIVLKPSLPFPLVRTVRNQNLEKPGLNRSSLVTWVDGSLYHIYLTLYTFEIVNFETYPFAFSTLQQKLVRVLTLPGGLFNHFSHENSSGADGFQVPQGLGTLPSRWGLRIARGIHLSYECALHGHGPAMIIFQHKDSKQKC